MTDQAEEQAAKSGGVRIVTGLSTSVLTPLRRFEPDTDLRGGHSRADHDQLVAKIAAAAIEARASSPASELTGIEAIWQHAGQPQKLELVVLLDGEDRVHSLIFDALHRCLEGMPLPRSLEVQLRRIDVGAAPTRVTKAADACWRVPDAVADDIFDPSATVYVNGSAGPSTTKLLLTGLATVRGATVFVNPEEQRADVAFLELPPVSLDRSETLRRLDAVDDMVRTPSEALGEPAHPGRTLIVRDDGASRPSRVVRHLANLASRTPMLRGYPAGAALLRRAGHGALASRLDALVSSWVRQRLWAFNLVPELVVHDDRHVERVDHLLAAMIAPAFQDGRLDPQEVFLLSCAAWLHDWGHVGGLVGTGFVTHPIDVRALHGLLTQARLRDYPKLHGLEDDVADRVGVLCAHHQGWTSLTDEPAMPGDVEEDALARFGVTPPTFDKAVADVGLDRERARLLVALLRVADAIDVGRHRVPHHDSLDDYLRSCAQHTLSRAAAEAPSSLSRAATETIKDLVADPLNANLRRALGVHAEDPFMRRIEGYLAFVDKQADYYRLHNCVLRVTVTHDDAGFVAVVEPAGGSEREFAAARTAVDRYVHRELKRPGDSHHVQTMLTEAGLVYAGTRLA